MSIKQILCSIAMLFTVSAFAQQSQPAAVASKDVPQDALAIEIAGKLVKYGYKTKTALPLIQAVGIFKSLNVCEESPESPKEQSVGEADSHISKTDVVSFDEKQLLADATKYADGNSTLLALIKDAEKSTRGVTPKNKEIKARIQGHRTDIWKFTFRGEELALVMVIGDGDTDLDIYVYDENDNLIDSDEGPDDNCSCTFIPYKRGVFTIKIVNRGSVYNNYVLITN